MCPDCKNGNNYPYNIPDPLIIPVSIDSTRTIYNIDEDFIYLTGGSCNGNSTIKYGLEYIYNFRGIISFNPFIPSIIPDYYDYDSDMTTCICSGTLDPNYIKAERIHDSIVAYDGNSKFISMEGVAHEYWIPEFNIEMMNCIYYVDSIHAIITSVKNKKEESVKVNIYPNPFKKQTSVEIVDMDGSGRIELLLYDYNGNLLKIIHQGILNNKITSFDIDIDRRGSFILKLITDNEVICRKIISL